MDEYKYIDLEPYLDPKKVQNFELFIGPKGEYYKVKTSYESDQNCTHYKWAKEYFKQNDLEKYMENVFINNKCKSEVEILIHYFGFIRYTHNGFHTSPMFDFPNRNYFGCLITSEQKESIYVLLTFNNEKITEELINKLENYDYEDKIDNYFQKNLRRE